jgi:hypothetical protein
VESTRGEKARVLAAVGALNEYPEAGPWWTDEVRAAIDALEEGQQAEALDLLKSLVNPEEA